MAFQYMERYYAPRHFPHPTQHRQPPHLMDDDYHYFPQPPRATRRGGPPQPHPHHLHPPAPFHDRYLYGPPPAAAGPTAPHQLYPQHEHQRIYPDCYESLPKRHSHSKRRHKLARSSSTGNLYRDYETEDDHRQDYSWYYQEPEQHVPQYYEHCSNSSSNSSRRRRCRSNSNNSTTQSHHPPLDTETIIDLDSYTHIDGEPMNELEVLAAKNAAINERKSRIIYQEEEEEDYAESVEQMQPLKETIDVAVPTAAAVAATQPTSTATTATETTEVPSNEATLVDDENLSNMLEVLAMTESNASTVVEPLADETSQKEALPQPAKKKRWPFAYLFKKPTTTTTTTTTTATTAATTDRGKVEPTKSHSTPPTPVLTPDTFTNSNISSTNTFATISPQHQISSHGFWAFRVPMTQVWYRFDNENQTKIFEHVSHPNGMLQVTDSHLGQGQVPIVVLPPQRICYYPTDASLHQLACLELCFMPSALGGGGAGTLY